MSMNPRPNKNTDQEMIDEFLNKGGKITNGKGYYAAVWSNK